jgi:hypothetical protein
MDDSGKSRPFKSYVITGIGVIALGAGYLYSDHVMRQNEEVIKKTEMHCSLDDCAAKSGTIMQCCTYSTLSAPRSMVPEDFRKTEANRFLSDLVGGNTEYSAYLTPGATRAIIHIRRPTEDQSASREGQNADIHDILANLTGMGIEKVYYEGLTPMMAQIRQLQSKLIHANQKEREFLEHGLDWLVKDNYGKLLVALVDSELMKEHNIYYENSKMLHGWMAEQVTAKRDYMAEAQRLYREDPVFRLAAEGKIRIQGAETIDSWLLGEVSRDSALREQPPRHKRKAYLDYFDARENMLLATIAKSTEPVAVLYWDERSMFGGAASCGEKYNIERREGVSDNIDQWNMRKKPVKFSLAEYTPFPKRKSRY